MMGSGMPWAEARLHQAPEAVLLRPRNLPGIRNDGLRHVQRLPDCNEPVSATTPLFGPRGGGGGGEGGTRAKLTQAGNLPCMKQALRKAARMGANIQTFTLRPSSSWT